VRDITGQLTVESLRQYVLLWRAMQHVDLLPAVEDNITCRWSPNGTYSARSAYRMFFEGSSRFAGAESIWRAWAPLKVKIFTWLVVWQRI
jgi:hypothetical protein